MASETHAVPMPMLNPTPGPLSNPTPNPTPRLTRPGASMPQFSTPSLPTPGLSTHGLSASRPSHADLTASKPREAASNQGPFVPMLLMACSLIAWFGFQTVQLTAEREQLSVAQAAVEPQAQNAAKLRASLDAVATATARLAADGNPTAAAMVDELRRRGVTISAAAKAPAR